MKNKIKSWIAGRVVSDILKKMNVDKARRKPVVKAVQAMIKPKKEPILYGGAIGVAVALGAAFGLDLTTEQLAVTISTVIAVVTFVQRKLVSTKADVKTVNDHGEQ